MKLKHLFLFLFLCTMIVKAQDRTLSVAEMHEDINFYLSTLRSLHPNLYAHYDASHFDTLMQELKQKTSEPLPISQFRWLISRFNRLTDVHTAVVANIRENQPFSWITVENGKTMLGDYILVDLGGLPANIVYNRIASLISWEINPVNKTGKINRLLLPYLLDFHQLELPIRSNLLNTNTGAYTYSLLNPSWEDWRANALPAFTSYHSDNINFRIYKEESIAVLFYNSSQISEQEIPSFVREVRAFFEEVEKNDIESIFIDVSHNSGGSDGTHQFIFRHLSWEPYQFEATIAISEDGRNIFSEGIANSMTSGASNHNFDDAVVIEEMKKVEKFSQNMKQGGADNLLESFQKEGRVTVSLTLDRQINGFNGNVFVIMGSHTYSAADTFCFYMALGQRAVLVGEASGQRVPYSGNVIIGELPHSNIPFHFPVTFVVFSTEQIVNIKDGFLQPCIPFPLTRPLGLEDYKQIIELAREKDKI